MIALLMILIGANCIVAIWHVLDAISRMSGATRAGIRYAMITKATGMATLLAAVLDHFFGAPYTWPWLMLVGVAFSTAGTAAMHVLSRRRCHCPECPVRERD